MNKSKSKIKNEVMLNKRVFVGSDDTASFLSGEGLDVKATSWDVFTIKPGAYQVKTDITPSEVENIEGDFMFSLQYQGVKCRLRDLALDQVIITSLSYQFNVAIVNSLDDLRTELSEESLFIDKQRFISFNPVVGARRKAGQALVYFYADENQDVVRIDVYFVKMSDDDFNAVIESMKN